MNHFAVYLKLTHYKSTILQFKKLKLKKEKKKNKVFYIHSHIYHFKSFSFLPIDLSVHLVSFPFSQMNFLWHFS